MRRALAQHRPSAAAAAACGGLRRPTVAAGAPPPPRGANRRPSLLQPVARCPPSPPAAGGWAPLSAAPTLLTPAAAALRDGTLGFSFSAGGLLFPYYIGVVGELRAAGALTPGLSRLGGASAGALIAACTSAGLSEAALLDATLRLCADCRANGTRFRLRGVLEPFLQALLPEDAHVRCSGRAHVAVTQLLPVAGGALLAEYASKAALIDALLTRRV
jgi:hypothetical protein